MSTRLGPTVFSRVRLYAALIAVAALSAGCVGAVGGPSTHGTPGASGDPSGSGSTSGFYMRTYQTQALPPASTFGWMPTSTIADGQYVDGMVATPAIYPGPLYAGMTARPISPDGIQTIIAEAGQDGLLGSKRDFSAENMPGSVLLHIELTVGGVTRDLTGPALNEPAPASAEPGTTAAFEAFWSKATSIETWLAPDLGASSPYIPTSLAVLVTPPIEAADGWSMAPTETPWPLVGSFATFGKTFGGADFRCGTVTGTDLAKLLPVVQASNQLTRFADATGAKASIQVVALVPSDAGPCA